MSVYKKTVYASPARHTDQNQQNTHRHTHIWTCVARSFLCVSCVRVCVCVACVSRATGKHTLGVRAHTRTTPTSAHKPGGEGGLSGKHTVSNAVCQQCCRFNFGPLSQRFQPIQRPILKTLRSALARFLL